MEKAGADRPPAAVPFEEDDKDLRTWFLDHNYVESMNDMFKKVNGKPLPFLIASPLPFPPSSAE